MAIRATLVYIKSLLLGSAYLSILLRCMRNPKSLSLFDDDHIFSWHTRRTFLFSSHLDPTATAYCMDDAEIISCATFLLPNSPIESDDVLFCCVFTKLHEANLVIKTITDLVPWAKCDQWCCFTYTPIPNGAEHFPYSINSPDVSLFAQIEIDSFRNFRFYVY